jgi:O-acetyl-ADP-ribose deacetylase (regulator of RNase III)
MIYKRGDLVDVDTGIIVHGCNAQGKMGSGVAKALKEKYPKMFTTYINDISCGYSLGYVSWYSNLPIMIASGITQEFYGREGKRYVSYDAIDIVMNRVFSYASRIDVPVHMPKIGAGTGGGNWDVIVAIIEDAAAKHGYSSDKIFIWEL